MAENGRLSPARVRFLEALLASPNTRDAAKQAKVSERSAWRWLADPVFQATLVAAKEQAFHEALERLKVGAGKAVETLEQSLAAESEGVRLRASIAWLEQAIDLHKMSEIESRFDELERLLQAAHLR